MSENYSEAERRLIESRTQSSSAPSSTSSVDQLSVPRIDKKPTAKDVNLPGMVDQVNDAARQQQASSPTVFDTMDKDMPWLKWVGGALGVLGAAYGVNRMLVGGDDNTPPPGGPRNRPPSPKDRSLTRTEPTLNAETTQSSMTAGEPKIVADPVPVAPKPVTDTVTVPGTPDTTASIIPTIDQPKVVPMPSEPQPQMKYGEVTMNAPTGAPSPVAPPAAAPAAPVAPAIPTAEELRYKAFQEDQRRKEELHQKKLATDTTKVKAAAETVQANQGKPLSNVDNTILSNAKKVEIEKSLEAQGMQKPKAAPAAPVKPAAATPPASTSDKFVLPISSNPAETALSKEQMSARGWLANQYGGTGKYYEAVQDIFGGVPPSYNAAAGEKAIGKDAHQVVMDWRKSNIEGPKVNLTHDMKKVLKGGGGMAVLMALPGFAEAAQNKDMGKMSDIFTDFFVLPFAQSREAGIPKAQEESIIAGKFKEASKLGSPYRSVPPPR